MIHYERCSCSAAVLTFSRRRAVEWRANHLHDIPEDDPVPFESNGAAIERAWREFDEARPEVVLTSVAYPPSRAIGFTL